MGLSGATLAMPSPVHIDSKTPDSTATAVVGRKHSFRGFSTSSLSSLTTDRGQRKGGSSQGLAKKGVDFIMSGFREADSMSDSSRPPSLITDDGSRTTSIISRSPSPEPASSITPLEAAFQSYSTTNSSKVLTNVLLPILAQSTRVTGGNPPSRPGTRASVSRKTSLTVNLPTTSTSFDGLLLEESDINVLFKWWNHLLLLSSPCNDTFRAIYAIAVHPAVRSTIFWNPHYELTLSTTLSLPSTTLSSTFFAKLIALGYVYHAPTSGILRNLFSDPTRVSSAEPWIKRVKNVEALVETIKHVYALSPELDDGGVVETRLEDMLCKVVNVSTYPNPRLHSLGRLIADAEGTFARKLEDSLVRVTQRVGLFESVATFYLLDLLSAISLSRLDFWLDVLERVIDTENHVLQIRVFAFLYDAWPTFAGSSRACDLLISPARWQYFFAHWSGIVRDHYMRLVAYKVCVTHPREIRALLMRSFETSLLENCQLRDCLPGNPIPNKRFVIRPVNTKASHYRPALRGSRPSEVGADITEADDLSPTMSLQQQQQQQVQQHPSLAVPKKKLGFFRNLWSEDHKEESFARPGVIESSTSSARVQGPLSFAAAAVDPRERKSHAVESEAPRELPQQQFRFVPEYVGKQWSLTSDADAIRFLDMVMDAAREGRLPVHCAPLSSPTRITHGEAGGPPPSGEFVHPFTLGQGRKQLWTRSLSEWSTILDDTDRYWRACGGRSRVSPTSGPRGINCPRLEVEFPRWFVQRATQVAGDGGREI